MAKKKEKKINKVSSLSINKKGLKETLISFLYSRKVLLVGELSVLDNYGEC